MRKRYEILSILIFVSFFCLLSIHGFAGQLPDTGQTACYDDLGNIIPCPLQGEDFYGQDANYTINPISYTKLDASGNDLPDEAVSWALIRDNVTGLIWEVKQDKNGVQNYNNPHDADNSYSWYDPNPATNGGYAGLPGNGTDTQDFIDALNGEYFGGYADWRMPSLKELSTITNYSISYPNQAINTDYFPNGIRYNWTSTTGAKNTDSAWAFDFGFGKFVLRDSKGYSVWVRAMRGMKFAPNFVDNGNGTVAETNSGLIWEQTVPSETFTWKNALSYCEALTLGGYTDWRLPNIKELMSLADYSRYQPSINTAYFPNTSSSALYWSSTTDVYDPAHAWGLVFNLGLIVGYSDSKTKKDNDYPCLVRCVRCGYSELIGITLTSPNTGGTFKNGDIVHIQWTTTNAAPSDRIAIGLKRDSVPPSQTEPDGVNWVRFADNVPNDGSVYIVIPDKGITEASDWRFYVRHVDSDTFDSSDATYTSIISALRILTPREGDSLVADNRVDIIWINNTNEDRCIIKLIQGDPGEVKFQLEVPNNKVCAIPLLGGLCPAGDNYRFCISSLDGTISDCTGKFSIREQKAQLPASFSFSEISSPQALKTPFPVTITALDEDGNVATGYNGQAYLTGPSSAVEPKFPSFTNGVANINVTLFNYFDRYLECKAYGATGRSNQYRMEIKVGSISGKLIKHNGDPIEGTSVRLDDLSDDDPTHDRWGQTDENGTFFIKDVKCGEYNVIITKGDYIHETIEEGVTISDGAPTVIRTKTIYYSTCTEPDCQTPVILIPGFMGSSSEYNCVVPRLPESPTPSDLHIHDPRGKEFNEDSRVIGFTKLHKRLVDEGFIVFDCPYDWTANLDAIWRRFLKPKIDQALLHSSTGKVNIVAHSMGGLVTRAYIQSDEYKNRKDIDKFIMVGTPNLGACTPYYMWEGGDPYTADVRGGWIKEYDPLLDMDYIEEQLLLFYTHTVKTLWDSRGKMSWEFNPIKIIWTNNPLNISNPLPERFVFIDKQRVKDFIQLVCPSGIQIMHTENFLQAEDGIPFGTSGRNENIWLKNLNTDPDIPNLMKNPLTSSEDKIAVSIFVGDSKDTLGKIKVRPDNDSELYFDGAPYDYENVRGDGTVTFESATWPCNEGWAELADLSSNESHASLIKDYCESIIDKLRVTPLLKAIPSKNKTLNLLPEENSPLLSVSTNGRVKIFLEDPLNRKLGLSPESDSLVEDIPDTNFELLANRGYLEVPNPGNGIYRVKIFGEYQRDFAARINYLHSDGTEEIEYMGFCGETPTEFSIIVDSAAANKITIQPDVDSPEEFLATPYGIENNSLVRLSWLPSEGNIAGYNVYRRSENEPYFKKIGSVTPETTSFDTIDRWEMTVADITCDYAVTAYAIDGKESFFSNLVRNDDRDLDWLTDIDEIIAGTNLNIKDTDGDSLEDGIEYYVYKTSPLLKDTDSDGYFDDIEIRAGSDPLNPDSVPLKGDVNGDHTVDLTDALVALQIAVGIVPQSIGGLTADVNGDNKIGMEETVYILEKVAGMRE